MPADKNLVAVAADPLAAVTRIEIEQILARLRPGQRHRVERVRSASIGAGDGPATVETRYVWLDVREHRTGAPATYRVVLKKLRRSQEADLRHWTFWEREALAYAFGVLPQGPTGLVAPAAWASSRTARCGSGWKT